MSLTLFFSTSCNFQGKSRGAMVTRALSHGMSFRIEPRASALFIPCSTTSNPARHFTPSHSDLVGMQFDTSAPFCSFFTDRIHTHRLNACGPMKRAFSSHRTSSIRAFGWKNLTLHCLGNCCLSRAKIFSIELQNLRYKQQQAPHAVFFVLYHLLLEQVTLISSLRGLKKHRPRPKGVLFFLATEPSN